MSMFLTPDARPFYAGTYFPPVDRHGLPSFKTILMHVAEVYRTRRGDVDEAANEILKGIGGGALQIPKSEQRIDRGLLAGSASRLLQNYDPVNGGFGGAPKFPPSMTLDF